VYSDLFMVTLNGQRVGNVSSGGTLSANVSLHRDRANVLKVESADDTSYAKEIRFVPHGATVRIHAYWELDWQGYHLKAELLKGASVPGPTRIHRVLLDDDVVVRKIDTEEYTLSEGVTVQPGMTTTLEEGVSFTRSVEYLGGIGIDLQAIKFDVGARVSSMLGKDIRQSTARQSITTLDGNVLESARVEWYARIRRGKVTLEADGTRRELPFEYVISYFPKVHSVPRRQPEAFNVPSVRVPAPIAKPATDPLLPRFGRVTAVSKEWPRLFEGRFETAVSAAKGDMLPVYRGRLAPKCIGVCKTVAVQDRGIVAECEGFTPEVGDMVGGPAGSAAGPARR
jgi:hypothetical protein